MFDNKNMAINKSNACDQIIDYIVDLITKGELHGGDKLPSERSLSEMFNVSRLPIREALRSLRQTGILETRHGEGTFVSKVNNSFLAKKLAEHMYSEETSIIEVLQFRILLESECARLAAESATEDEVKAIGLYKEKAEEAEKFIKEGKYEAFVDSDYEFHKTIAKASHNELYYNLFRASFKALRLHQYWSLNESNEIYDYIGFHDEIYKTIKDKQPDKAYESMKSHLDCVMGLILKSLK